MKYLSIVLLLISLKSTSCIKSASECPRYFQIYTQLTPVAEEYNIGDTLTIISKFHRKVYENQTMEKYDMEGINWSPLLTGKRIDIDEIESHTRDYFNFVPNSRYDLAWFDFSGGSSSLTGKFDYTQDTFNIEIQLILKTEGLYYFTFGSGLIKSKQDFPGKCKHTDFDVLTRLNNEEDNNIHLLQEAPNSHYNDWILQKPEARFYDGGSYAFRVIE